MLTFHSYHFQPDTLTQIRECQSNNRDFAPAPSDTVQSHPPSSASSSPGRIRTHRSFQHHRQSSTSGTPLPLSLRHRIRPQAQAQAQGTSSSPPSTTSSPNQNHPATFLPYPLLSIDPTSLRMSRPTSSSATSRPTHIPLPNNNFTPTGTPLATPPIGTAASPASPRHSFLGFMRTRGRANTLNASQAPAVPPSPSLDRSRNASSREGSAGPHMSRETTTGAATGGSVTRSISTPLSGGGLNISTNTNANVNTNGNGDSPRVPGPAPGPGPSTSTTTAPPASSNPNAKTYRIRLVPHLESTRSLAFDPVIRELLPIIVPPGVLPAIAAQSVSAAGPQVNGRPPALLLKIGRFTDKSNNNNNNNLPVPGGNASAGGSATVGPNSRAGGVGGGGGSAHLTIAGGGGDLTSGKVAFKSKVVSRGHAEIWCEEGGKFYIRDTSSSSGTFLNHIRLSSPNTDSRPTMLNDGDILQLGVDYQGGIEEMFRCVKIRVEIGREWQSGANEFNTNALKQLKALGGATDTKDKEKGTPSKKAKASVTDCCICLFSVTVCQSLFIAPCSHVFHYKCIRPLLLQHHPGFSCPLCRTFANLEEDVETEDAWEIASRRASIISRRPSNHSIRIPNSSSQVEPSGPTGEPSTNIGLGGTSTASVNDLLSTESEETGGEGMIGSSALARQTTAVATAQEQQDVEMDLPDAVLEEPEGEGDMEVENGRSIPIAESESDSGGNNGFGGLQDVATPMNEHFLSTLAIDNIGNGIAQRLDLADELVNTPTTATGSGHGNANEDGEARSGMYT